MFNIKDNFMILKKIKKYFGLDLPVRDIILQFQLPSVSEQLAVGYGGDKNFIDRLDAAKENPEEYFSILRNAIKRMNRCAMKPRHRLTLTREILELFYPAVLESLTEMADKKRNSGGGGKDIPEEQNRKHALAHMAEIAKILITSYQIIFTKIYEGKNFQYARAHVLREECVSFIFELTLLRQQVAALRYQLLDAVDWHCVNTLFYAMSCYDDVQKPRETLAKQLNLDTSRTSVSWKNQFAELHMVAQFDMLHWPTRLQWVIGTYVHGVENSVLTNPSQEKRPSRNQIMTYCYASQAAQREALLSEPGPALLLDFNGLSQAIRSDCIDLLQAKKKRDKNALPARFTRFPEAEHFVISDLLLRGMQSIPTTESAEGGIDVSDFQIYVGFSSVFSLLNHRQSIFSAEKRLADSLARRSAQIATDKRATETSGWRLLMQTETHMRLSTQENGYTTPMSIGSLLAYGQIEQGQAPKLAVVSRIYRPNNKHVLIDISILANDADAILMSVNPTSKSSANDANFRSGNPAILLFEKNRSSLPLLMFPPQDVLPGIDRIEIFHQEQTRPIELKNWRNATHDFYLYTTQ